MNLDDLELKVIKAITHGIVKEPTGKALGGINHEVRELFEEARTQVPVEVKAEIKRTRKALDAKATPQMTLRPQPASAAVVEPAEAWAKRATAIGCGCERADSLLCIREREPRRDMPCRCECHRASATPEAVRPEGDRSTVVLTASQLLQALDFIAPDRTPEQFECECCITSDDDGTIAYDLEYPDEGSVTLTIETPDDRIKCEHGYRNPGEACWRCHQAASTAASAGEAVTDTMREAGLAAANLCIRQMSAAGNVKVSSVSDVDCEAIYRAMYSVRPAAPVIPEPNAVAPAAYRWNINGDYWRYQESKPLLKSPSCALEPLYLSPPPSTGSDGQDAWQPIECAPKDGTSVLLYQPWKSGVNCRSIGHYANGWISQDFSDDDRMEIFPTHWQSLPKPPIDAAMAQLTARSGDEGAK